MLLHSFPLGAMLALGCLSSVPLVAQSQDPAASRPTPTRIETLASQTRILARLIERRLVPNRDYFSVADRLVNDGQNRGESLWRADSTAPTDAPSKTDPTSAERYRVVGEEPPAAEKSEDSAARTYWDVAQLYRSASGAQGPSVHSAVVPGTGAMLWIECEVPARWGDGRAQADAGEAERSEWDRAKDEIEGRPPQASARREANLASEGSSRHIDSSVEDRIVQRIQGVVLEHAARLDALEGAESITIVLRLRGRTALDAVIDATGRFQLSDAWPRSAWTQAGNNSLDYPRALATTGAPAAAAAQAPNVVRILRCPRLPSRGEAPKELQTVVRYEER